MEQNDECIEFSLALTWSSHFTGLNEEKCSCESTQFGRIFPIPWGKSCNCCPRCLRMNFNWRIAYQASKPCLFELNSRENRANETLLNCLLSLWWLENWTCLLIFYLHSTLIFTFYIFTFISAIKRFEGCTCFVLSSVLTGQCSACAITITTNLILSNWLTTPIFRLRISRNHWGK